MPTELGARLRARDPAAVAQALNLIEDARPAKREAASALLAELEARGGEALRVGVTGAPGAGKSTLIDALVRELRARKKTVGIVAVDPSSQKSGGALLGDRLRLRSGAADDGVFLRSMAARDRLGGLSAATRAGVEVLASAFDVVFVETVGVGQSEAEVMHLVHSLVFVAQPGAGDSIQFMKAGLIEVPDVFVVNKSDLGAMAERTCSELQGGLGLNDAGADGWTPPVLLASARDAKGIDAVVDALYAHRHHLAETGTLRARLDRGRLAWLVTALRERYGSYGVEAIGGVEAVEAHFATNRAQTFPEILSVLSNEIEAALGTT
ncbi:MAG: methylmalonyl Co-A mutase-associated GTPase MeaB [Myxococcota bacterium]|nr:methylmalonyl Co-A mutase-associated GTPase MeaB [Myxococcota bacterium]